MNNAEKFPHLLECMLLRNLPESLRVTFLNDCLVRSYSEPTKFLFQNKTAPGVFLVASGYVNVTCAGPDGSVLMLNRARHGDCLGDMEVLAEEPCAASCETAGAATLLFCTKQRFFEAMAELGFVRNLAAIAYWRMRRDNEFRAIDMSMPIQQKLCTYLRLLANNRNEVSESQTYLAQIVNCSRQTINKELGQLRDDGVVQISRGFIQILDTVQLERIAQRKPTGS